MISLRRSFAALSLATALTACGAEGAKGDYVNDSAAAPATVITPNNPGAPDSTAGMSQRTGTPGVAGTRQGVDGDSGMRPTSPASSTPKRP